MGLEKHYVRRDRFEFMESDSKFAFPCSCCAHRWKSQDIFPCCFCDHNENSKPTFVCNLCTETESGEGEYLGVGTPAMIGPICATCKNTILGSDE